MTVPSTAHADPFEVSTTAGGPEIHLLRTDKYKTLTLAWVLECPLDGSRGARALVTDLLTRGTASYPDLSQLAARCEELYAAEISSSASASGDRQLLRFGLEVVSDRFTSEPILDVAVGLLEESLHRPPLEDGRFRADHFAQERTNLVNAIESLAEGVLVSVRDAMDNMFHPTGALVEMIDTLHVDGVVYHPIKSCRTVSTGLADSRRALMEVRDIPSLFIESDMMDRRVVSEAQLKNRVDAFFEGLATRRQRVAAG